MEKHKKSSRDRGYKEVLDHMIRDEREKWKIFVDGVALSMPLLAAFSWYVSLIFQSMSSATKVKLSPGKTEPIIVIILVFIVAYGIFLMFEYNILRKRLKKIQKNK